MTGLLASVTDRHEARLAAAAVDIVDFKDPSRGALGALSPRDVSAARAQLPAATVTSATAGDLPLRPEPIRRAVAATAASGVDFVKVGLFTAGASAAQLRDAVAALRVCGDDGARVVVVLFADQRPDFELLPRLAEAGCRGVMLDTADKRAGGLRQQLADAVLGRFVHRAAALGLMTGLAGSLRVDDVAALRALRPDYLGFRGALCDGGRAGVLSAERLAALRALLPAATVGGGAPA